MVTQPRQQKVIRTFFAKLHVSGEGQVLELARESLVATVTAVSVAVQQTLKRLKECLTVVQTPEGRVQSADLDFPISLRDLARAERNAAKSRQASPSDKGPKELARPRYRNSYRIEEVLTLEGQPYVRARIAEAFAWRSSRGATEGRVSQELEKIDATVGFQQLIQSWLRPSLAEVPKRLRPGVCQQAAQQLLSHLGLIESQTAPVVSFPSREERHPDRRNQAWLAALDNVAAKQKPFLYQRARDLQPARYAPDDPRGDRLVNVDPEWVAFIRSPESRPLPLNFVGSIDVIIYERQWSEKRRAGVVERRRLYAALPLFEDVDPASPLGRLAATPDLAWWRDHLEEFHPLPVWTGRELEDDDPILLVPLEYDLGRRVPNNQRVEGQPIRQPSRFQSAFTGLGGRRVNWSLLVQRQRRRGKKRARTEWEIHFATSREVAPTVRPNVLGVHFGVDPIIWWALADTAGDILEEGRIAGNAILAEGLRQKLRLEENYQGKLRWVGERRYATELKRRTVEVSSAIIALAAQRNANLALEDIHWVDKRSGGHDANRRFSLWNFGQLRDRISWQGLERQVAQASGQATADPVKTLAPVSDYVLRYTCPACGACRLALQSRDLATTWREDEILHCRKCNLSGAVPDDHQARLVAKVGAERLRRLLA